MVKVLPQLVALMLTITKPRYIEFYVVVSTKTNLPAHKIVVVEDAIWIVYLE
jgi:hypothetical protein